MKNHIDDPLKLRWDRVVKCYKVNKPNINEAELIDASIGIELLAIIHNARLKLDELQLTDTVEYVELSRGIELLTGTD